MKVPVLQLPVAYATTPTAASRSASSENNRASAYGSTISPKSVGLEANMARPPGYVTTPQAVPRVVTPRSSGLGLRPASRSGSVEKTRGNIYGLSMPQTAGASIDGASSEASGSASATFNARGRTIYAGRGARATYPGKKPQEQSGLNAESPAGNASSQQHEDPLPASTAAASSTQAASAEVPSSPPSRARTALAEILSSPKGRSASPTILGRASPPAFSSSATQKPPEARSRDSSPKGTLASLVASWGTASWRTASPPRVPPRENLSLSAWVESDKRSTSPDVASTMPSAASAVQIYQPRQTQARQAQEMITTAEERAQDIEEDKEDKDNGSPVRQGSFDSCVVVLKTDGVVETDSAQEGQLQVGHLVSESVAKIVEEAPTSLGARQEQQEMRIEALQAKVRQLEKDLSARLATLEFGASSSKTIPQPELHSHSDVTDGRRLDNELDAFRKEQMEHSFAMVQESNTLRNDLLHAFRTSLSSEREERCKEIADVRSYIDSVQVGLMKEWKTSMDTVGEQVHSLVQESTRPQALCSMLSGCAEFSALLKEAVLIAAADLESEYGTLSGSQHTMSPEDTTMPSASAVEELARWRLKADENASVKRVADFRDDFSQKLASLQGQVNRWLLQVASLEKGLDLERESRFTQDRQLQADLEKTALKLEVCTEITSTLESRMESESNTRIVNIQEIRQTLFDLTTKIHSVA